MIDSITKLRAYLLCKYAENNTLYESWISDVPNEVVLVDQCPTEFQPTEDCGIVITHEHYRWEESNALRRIHEQRQIPTLVLADGILEFRNTWQNPTIPDGSMYQPLMADKIACIGNSSARLIESWGNDGKTEIVGLPRLDGLQSLPKEPNSESTFTLVVATANSPAFDEKQRASVLDSLHKLKNELSAIKIPGKQLKVEWRLSAGLDNELGIETTSASPSLLDTVQSSDAVVTTPSTIFLESALLNKPTAILDFSNSPQFTQSAWTISAPNHIVPVIQELAHPPHSKLLFQDYILNDSLQTSIPASSRMIELITNMTRIGFECRSKHQQLTFPNRILPDLVFESRPLRLSATFPENSAFSVQEINRLQAELSQAQHRLGTLPVELNEKNLQISQLQAALDESRRRVADVRARLFKLRKILGIGKENQTEEIAAKKPTK